MSTRYVWEKYSIKNITAVANNTSNITVPGYESNSTPPRLLTITLYEGYTTDDGVTVKGLNPTTISLNNDISAGGGFLQVGSLAENQGLFSESGDFYLGGILLYYSAADPSNGSAYYNSLGLSHARKVTASQVKGDLVGYDASQSNLLPADGIDGSYWYVLLGTDTVDPQALSYSTAMPKGGQTITISVTPAANNYVKITGEIVIYVFEVSLDGGSTWSLISSTTGTSVAYTIPKGAAQFMARVYVKDGFNSYQRSDYATGDNLDVINNTAPMAPATITVPDYVKGGGTLEVNWDAASDVDDNLTGYKLERSYNGGSWVQIYQGTITSYTDRITHGWATVQYRVKSYDDDGDESGYITSDVRTVTNTVAPTAPASITVPVAPVASAQITITWTAATDADGDLEGYALERQLDDGEWTEIYRGAAPYYVDTFAKGFATTTYRVRAYDSEEQYSDYTTSATRTVNNNAPPVIVSTLSGDLGVKSEGFTVPYIVTDAEGGIVTVTEQVGDLIKRTYEVVLGEEQTFHVEDQDGDYFFMRILNGEQKVKITATDVDGLSATLELPFTKAVHAMSVTLENPLEVADAITVAIMSVLGSIPDDAEFQVLVTNNAKDEAPVWQDATAAIRAGTNIVFANTVQTNGPAFNFKLTVSRAEGGQGGYIKMLKGAFQ